MIYAPLLVLSVVLFELFLLLKVGRDARTIAARSREAMRVLTSADLADEEKESSMRAQSAAILGATLRLAAKLLLLGAVLVALFLLIVAAFPHLERALLASLMSPAVIVILTAAIIGYAWARKLALARL